MTSSTLASGIDVMAMTLAKLRNVSLILAEVDVA